MTTLKYTGHEYFRQRLIMSTLSGRTCKISEIRPLDDNPGLRDYEASFLRLLDKVTNGTQIDIDHTGTSVIYRPGLIINGRKLTHDCGTARGIGYFLEGLICLAPFGKVPLHITLKGITNHRLDPSVDVVRTVSIPLLARFGVDDGAELKVVRRGAPPLGGGMIVFQCPVVRGIKPLQLTEVGKVKRIRGLAYSTRVAPTTSNRVVDAARGLLNTFIPDVFIYTDHYSGEEAGSSPGFGMSLVAETTEGIQYSSELPAEKGQAPEDLGLICSKLLCEEISRGGSIDTQHQHLCVLLMAIGPEDVSKVRVGKLSSFCIQYLRDIRDFFGVKFKIKADVDTGTTLLSCMGSGYMNLNKKIG